MTSDRITPGPVFSDVLRKIRERTPARIFTGRSGAAYRTEMQLDLRDAHAAARDAVRAELDMESAFSAAFIQQWDLFEVVTQARSKDEYLQRPDLGRSFSVESAERISNLCPHADDIQIAIGDGLSVTAVMTQVPTLLPLLYERAKALGWSVGRTFLIRHCRVGILNDIGELLSPRVTILLIGERPGLATAESLSAYLAYLPNASHTDANRNLISNIHRRGIASNHAADRILNFASRMIEMQTSGVTLREQIPDSTNRPLKSP